MAQGNIPGYGLDRREVTQGVEGQAPRGQKVEAATVPLSPVMSPRPSSFAQAGKSQAMMAEALKWGGQYLGELVERENRKNLLEGQALYAQGKSLEDLKKDGATAFTEHGWRLMSAQTEAATWHAAVNAKIDESDHALNPDEFRTKMTGMLSDFTKGKDEEQVGMIMSTAMKYMPDIIETQIKKHYAYRENQTFTSAANSVAAAKSVKDTDGTDVGKRDWLVLHSPDPVTYSDESGQSFQLKSPMGNLSPERYAGALAAGIVKAYEDNNPNAHMWAKEAGYIGKLTAEQTVKVNNAEADFKRRRENEFDEGYTLLHASLIENVLTGKLSLAEALRKDKDAQEARGWLYEAKDANDFTSAYRSEQQYRRSEAHADKRAAEAEARQIKREQDRDAKIEQQAILTAAWGVENQADEKRLLNGEITADEYLNSRVARAKDLGIKINGGVTSKLSSDIEKAFVERQRTEAETVVIDRALATRNFAGLSEPLVQKALRAQEDRLTRKWLDKGAADNLPQEVIQEGIKRDWIEFWATTGVVDKKARDVITAFARTTGVQADGTVPQVGIQAFAQFAEMYNKSPDLALQHVQGDAEKARLLTMLRHYDGQGGYAPAIRDGLAALKVDPSDRSRAEREAGDVTKFVITKGWGNNVIDTALDDYFTSRDVGLLGALFSKKHSVGEWANFRQSDLETVKEKYIPVVRDRIVQRAGDLLTSKQVLSPKDAAEIAASAVLGEYAVMGDALIHSPQGKAVIDKMFTPSQVDDRLVEWGKSNGVEVDTKTAGPNAYRGRANIENEALRVAIQQLGPKKWPEEWGQYKPGVVLMNPLDTARELATGPKVTVTPDPGGNGVFVRMERPDETYSSPKFMSFREIGIAWEREHKRNNK